MRRGSAEKWVAFVEDAEKSPVVQEQDSNIYRVFQINTDVLHSIYSIGASIPDFHGVLWKDCEPVRFLVKGEGERFIGATPSEY